MKGNIVERTEAELISRLKTRALKVFVEDYEGETFEEFVLDWEASHLVSPFRHRIRRWLKRKLHETRWFIKDTIIRRLRIRIFELFRHER